MISISLERGGFDARLGALLGQARNPTGLLMAAGRELGNRLQSWFRQRDKTGANRLSARREHFWLQVARSVNAPAQTGYNQVSVRVSDPRLAQKVFGGKISAKAAGALTIPVSEEAYGRTAATFEAETGLKLFLVRTGRAGALGSAVLATKRAAGEKGGLQVEYVLVKSVDQAADPDALPPMSELEAAVLSRAQDALVRQLQVIREM